MPFSIIRNQRIKDKCQIFTPADIVTKMLDLANYRDNLFGKKYWKTRVVTESFFLKLCNDI